MVREILTVQLGQCGNNIGNMFWSTLLDEHKLDRSGTYTAIADRDGDDSKMAESKQADASSKAAKKPKKKKAEKPKKSSKSKSTPKSSSQKASTVRAQMTATDHIYLDKLNVFFYESVESLRYVPRSIFVDLDPSVLDSIKASRMGKLYKNDNFVLGQNSAANNYAKGRYTEGADLEDEVMELIRRESEDCDCLQSIQMTHAIGGGTGSGLGSLISQNLRDYYRDRILCGYTIFPSKTTSQIVVEDYNAILAMNDMIGNVDESFVMDNHSLYNICEKLKLDSSLRDLNGLISMAMSGITSSLRFPGQLNGDLRKLGVNLVPFPRLHFFTIAQFPLFQSQDQYTDLTIRELTQGIMDRETYYADIKPGKGKCLAASILYRGSKDKVSTYEVEHELSETREKYWEDFVEWIPWNIKTSVINVPIKGYDLSSTFVANHTGVISTFKRIISNVNTLLKRKAFLHRYKEEGLEERDIMEAIANVKDLMEEYKEKQNIDTHPFSPMGLVEQDQENEDEQNDQDADVDGKEA